MRATNRATVLAALRATAPSPTPCCMAGFPVMGGQRDDPVMRFQTFPLIASPIGEADDSVTDRTRQVAAHLRRMRGQRITIRRDMDAWLVTHVTLVSTYLGVYAAGLDAARYARTRDARLLGVRARTEALRAQRAAGIPVRPAWFHLGLRIPEPLVVAQLRAMAAMTLFEVGAREEPRRWGGVAALGAGRPRRPPPPAGRRPLTAPPAGRRPRSRPPRARRGRL